MRIAPYPWPENKKCAVFIAVYFDDGLDALARVPDLAQRPKSYSVWEYGARRGVERLLSTFTDFDMMTSWFIPGSVVEKHGSFVHEIAQQGHEIAARGWNFEIYEDLDRDQSLGFLKRSCQIIETLDILRPRGFSLPIGHWPIGFDQILTDAGFDWSASLNGDDRPYTHKSGLVEIAVHRELEDRPYFQFNFTPPFPKGLSRLPSYRGVLENWFNEFDAYREYGLCFVLQIRPEVIATPGRIYILRDLLQYIKSFEDVWWATGSMIADWHKSQKCFLTKDHPIEVFTAYRRENGYYD